MTAGEFRRQARRLQRERAALANTRWVHTNDMARRLEAAGFVRQVVQQEWMTRGILVLNNEKVTKSSILQREQAKVPRFCPGSPELSVFR